MRKIIIAFSGFKQSGKDTSVNLLTDYIESNRNKFNTSIIKKMSFSENIKYIIYLLFGIKEEDITDKEQVIKSTKKFFRKPKSYRDLCILIGDGLKTSLKCNDIWSKSLEKNILSYRHDSENNSANVFIISDVRYKSELKMLQRMRKRGYEVYHICVFRKDALPDWAKLGLNLNSQEEKQIIVEDFSPEKSEWEWCESNLKFNFIIKNDGSIDELNEQVKHVADTILIS